MDYPEKSTTQLTSARGEIALRSVLPPEWSVQEPQKDFGEDFVVDVFDGVSTNLRSGRTTSAVATGRCFGAQLKSMEKPKSVDGHAIPVRLKLSTLNYLAERDYPTFLVVCTFEEKVQGIDAVGLMPHGPFRGFPQFYFAKLNSFKEVIGAEFASRTRPETVTVNVPLANDLSHDLRSDLSNVRRGKRSVSLFRRLIGGDQTARQIELCRTGAVCKWRAFDGPLMEILEQAATDDVRAEALMALGLRGSILDLNRTRAFLFSRNYTLMAGALSALGSTKAQGARELLLEFAKNFHRNLHLVRESKSRSEDDDRFANLNEHYVLASLLMRALGRLAGSDDSASVDLLMRYWGKPDRTGAGGVGKAFLQELYNRSSPGQQQYIAKRLKDWMVGLGIELPKESDRVRSPAEFVAVAIDRLDDRFSIDDHD